MIVKVDPEDSVSCSIRDDMGGALTVHPHGPKGMVGLVVSDRDKGGSTAALLLGADERRALAAALLDGLDS